MRRSWAALSWAARWLCAAAFVLPLSTSLVPARPARGAGAATFVLPVSTSRVPARPARGAGAAAFVLPPPASLVLSRAALVAGVRPACCAGAAGCACERAATPGGECAARRPAYGRPPSEVERLRRDVKRLERLVAEICGALVYSDDVALMERSAAALGPIYRDASFSASRRPVFARRAVECVLAARGLVATPPVRAWRTTVQTDEPDEPLF